MNCEYIVRHRLRNLKPPKRYERCGKPAGLRKIAGWMGFNSVWLCKQHWRCVKRVSTKLPEISTRHEAELPIN